MVMRHLLDVVVGFEPTLGDTFATALPNANFSQQTVLSWIIKANPQLNYQT
jgi:hypothetical protein